MEKDNENKKNENIENKEEKQYTQIYDFKKSDLEKKEIFKIILIIILIIALLIGGYFVYKTFIKDKVEESNDNTTVNNSINLNTGTITGNGIVKNDNIYTINTAGIYTITGTNYDSSIVIDTTGDVNINLDNANIKSNTQAAILGKNCDNLAITLKDETINSVADGGDSEYDAAIFSNCKLKITGNGTLNATGNVEEGIATETNDLTIENGKINIVAKDDGINAGGDGGTITINGGTIYVNASGDGIDSNQNIIINGGTIFVMGSSQADNAAMDSDNLYKVAGGTLVALGNGMLETPSNQSTQNTILFNLSTVISSNTLVALLNEDNEVIVAFNSEKSFTTITISTNNLKEGKYSLYTGGSYSENEGYGIYSQGAYTKGNILAINNQTVFEISDITNWFGKTTNMEGQPNNLLR